MLDALVGGVGVVTDRSADSADLVCGHRRPNAAAADHDSPLCLARRHRPGQGSGEVGVVIQWVDCMGTDIRYLMAHGLQQLGNRLLERVPVVVCAHGYPHLQTSVTGGAYALPSLPKVYGGRRAASTALNAQPETSRVLDSIVHDY